MRIIYIAVALISGMMFSLQSNAQNTCDNGRYINRSFFDSVTVDAGVTFGVNDSATGSGTQTLKMDVYQPFGDTLAKRPVVIIAFGGSFIGGKRGDVAGICEDFAKMGYIAIAPDYRYALSAVFPPNQRNVTLEVLRSSQDLKAVVRYLRKDFSTINTYKVDTSAIIMGGVSAGAIAGIHAAYLKDTTSLPAYLTTSDTAGFGGIEGNSGSPGYSSKVAGVISYSGTIGDSLWIQSGDAPIFMVHDTTDPTVPFGTAQVYISGFATGLIASGDGAMDAYMNRIGGVTHKIRTYNHGWHVDYLNQDYDSVIAATARFLVANDNVCKSTIESGITEVTTDASSFAVYPNPTEGNLTIRNTNGKAYNLNVYNTLGQLVYTRNQISDVNTNLTLNVEPGFYIVKMTRTANNANLATEKLIVR